MDNSNNVEKHGLEMGPIGTRVLFEDERVRVWDLTLESGEMTAWHQHAYDYLFIVVEKGKVYTEYIDSTVEHQDSEIGHVELRRLDDDQAHRLVNNDIGRYRNIIVELKISPQNPK